MSKDLAIKEAKRRKEVFESLDRYLKELKERMRELDEDSKVFLFGSVARDEHVLMSDIDVLILTRLKPSLVIANLRKLGFEDPFEFHVVNEEEFKIYRSFIKDLREV